MRSIKLISAPCFIAVALALALASEAAPITPKVGTGDGQSSKSKQFKPELGKAITVSTAEQKKMLEANVKELQAQSADIKKRLDRLWQNLERLEASARPETQSAAALCIAINSVNLDITTLNSRIDTKSKSELNKEVILLNKSLSLLISEKNKISIVCEGDS